MRNYGCGAFDQESEQKGRVEIEIRRRGDCSVCVQCKLLNNMMEHLENGFHWDEYDFRRFGYGKSHRIINAATLHGTARLLQQTASSAAGRARGGPGNVEIGRSTEM